MECGHCGKTRVLIAALLPVMLGVALWFLVSRFLSSGKIQNVVLISIDTCRADFLSCYGCPMPTTPNIDSVAKEGIVFENAVSPLPFTLPAHCSMLTGTIPPSHGVLDNGLYILEKDNITLAEILKQKGFTTAGFVSSFVLNSDFGMDQGFNDYDDEFGQSRNTMGILERQGEETTELALSWIEENRDEKQFLFVHYFDPHFTYDAPAPFGSKFVSAKYSQYFQPRRFPRFAAYAGEVAYVDHCIGKIIKKLKELKLYDSTLICITADHGEMHGQHGEFTHGYFIYEGNIHVPLVFKIPGRKKGLRVENTVGLVDIVPTICSSLGIDIDHKIQGVDLTAYYKNRSPYPDRYLYCQSLEPTKYNANPLLGLVTDQYKYILTTNSEMYDLDKDKFESDNLIKTQPQLARIMQDTIRQILEDAIAGEKKTSGSGLDTETLAKLESLGYVGSSVDDSFDIDPQKEDPKDLIDYHVMGAEVGYFIQTGDHDAAEKLCRKMIEQKPEQYMGYFKTAISLSHRKKYAESVDYLLKMIELEKDNPFAYAGLANGYRKQEQFDIAIDYARKALELKSDFIMAYYYLSACYYEKGLFDDPEKYLTSQISEHPSYLKVLEGLAVKLYEKGQIKRSFEKHRKLVELDPESFDALNSVAWFQAASTIDSIRNPQQALKHAARACELVDEDQLGVALDTLAAAYAAAGDFKMAIQTADKAIEAATIKSDTALAGRIQKRKALYLNGKPYIDAQLRISE
jgi:arylsulfatase A-like enzyme/Tfp pilus assembly protein PilF